MSKTVQRKETDIVSRKKDSFRSRCQVENRLISREKDVWTEEISRNNRKEKKVTNRNKKKNKKCKFKVLTQLTNWSYCPSGGVMNRSHRQENKEKHKSDKNKQNQSV